MYRDGLPLSDGSDGIEVLDANPSALVEFSSAFARSQCSGAFPLAFCYGETLLANRCFSSEGLALRNRYRSTQATKGNFSLSKTVVHSTPLPIGERSIRCNDQQSEPANDKIQILMSAGVTLIGSILVYYFWWNLYWRSNYKLLWFLALLMAIGVFCNGVSMALDGVRDRSNRFDDLYDKSGLPCIESHRSKFSLSFAPPRSDSQPVAMPLSRPSPSHPIPLSALPGVSSCLL
jgi:hypothetical protein